LRGDADSRARFYTAMFNMGAISANEIRARENLNSVTDGDRYFVQQNLMPLDMVDEILKAKAEPQQPAAPRPNGAAEPARLNGAAH